jgi:hypothetical protein
VLLRIENRLRSPPLLWYFPHDQHTTVVCGGRGLNKYQGCAADYLQRPLLRRVRFRARLTRSVGFSCQRPSYATDGIGGQALFVQHFRPPVCNPLVVSYTWTEPRGALPIAVVEVSWHKPWKIHGLLSKERPSTV